MTARLRSISPEATPEEVAAILAAVAAVDAGRGAESTRDDTLHEWVHAARLRSHRAGLAARTVAPVRPHRSPQPRLTPMTAVAHAELMSVGPDEVVVTFTTAPGDVGDDTGRRRRGHDRRARTTPPGSPGSSPTPSTPLVVEGAAPDQWLPARVRTLARPAGRLLATIATANDVHFGETECGRTGDPATDAIGPVLRRGAGEHAVPRGDERRGRRRDARARSRRGRGQGRSHRHRPRRGVRGVPRVLRTTR